MDLLIEIGVEELPAIPLLKELANIRTKWQKVLEDYHLQSEFEFFYTPRRLVLWHENFAFKQEDSTEQIIGAPRNVAFKDGKLTPAGSNFLEKTGLKENELEFREVKGKEVLYFEKKITGKQSAEVLPVMIETWLKSLNFGKSMRWGSGEFEFIRPVRSLVCLLGGENVKFQCFGVSSAKKTFVHRSVSYDLMDFADAAQYFKLLKENFVILNQNERRVKIEQQMREICAQNALVLGEDEELLNEVVAITEYPNALLGGFDKDFLALPSEVIITSMRENQRYFALFNENALSNHFIVVANAICTDFSKIIAGNERVLRARLADAMFFYENDLKEKLRPEKLEKIQYLEGLGTLKDKADREKEIAKVLCEIYQFDKLVDILSALEYAKADLCTQMVYEFGNLQGVMGYYYAKAQGFSSEICTAIKEQYLPNFEGASLPSSLFSSIVALANKFDTLMALFSLNKLPSGTKDPFALRRAASGAIKIILNLNTRFDLQSFLTRIAPLYKSFDLGLLLEFFYERLFTLYAANASFIKASLASKNTDLIHIDKSIKALINLAKNANFMQDFATFKRLANIAQPCEFSVDENSFVEGAEKELFSAFKKCDLSLEPEPLLSLLFALKPFIDNFFDKVMINAENERLKNNRKALVYQIYSAFLSVADIKELSL